MTDKVYTDEVTADIKARYVDGVDAGLDYDARSELVKEIADELEVSVASVRSKLTREGVYVGKEKAKGKGASTSKAEIVAAIGAIVGKDVKSFEKATKADLEALFEFIKAEALKFELGE